MQKKIFILTSLIAFASFAAEAKKDLYVRFEVGYSKPTGQFNKSPRKFKGSEFYSAALGYVQCEKIRYDISVIQRGVYKMDSLNFGSNVISQKFRSSALMFNSYYSPKKFNKFTPYVNIGLGASVNLPGDLKAKNSRLNMETYTLAEKKLAFAWQAGLGINFDLSTMTALDLGYRYSNLGKLRTKGIMIGAGSARAIVGEVEPRITNHEFLVGVILKF